MKPDSMFKSFLLDFFNITLLSVAMHFVFLGEWTAIKTFQFIAVGVIIGFFLITTFQKKKVSSALLFLGAYCQFIIYDLLRSGIILTVEDYNSLLIRFVFDLLIFVILSALLKVILDFPSAIKFIFYVLIALTTYLLNFQIKSYDCIDMVDYEKYQACVRAMSDVDLIKNNTVNIFVIAISIFEALSNVISIFKSNKKKNDCIKKHAECS